MALQRIIDEVKVKALYISRLVTLNLWQTTLMVFGLIQYYKYIKGSYLITPCRLKGHNIDGCICMSKVLITKCGMHLELIC